MAAGEQRRDQSLDRTLELGEGRKISLSSSGRSWAAFPLSQKMGKSPLSPGLCVVPLPRDFPWQRHHQTPSPGVCLGSLLPQGQPGLGLHGRTLQQQMELRHLWNLMKLSSLLVAIFMELHPRRGYRAASKQGTLLPQLCSQASQDVSANIKSQPAAA